MLSFIFAMLLLSDVFTPFQSDGSWLQEAHKGYRLFYKSPDKSGIADYAGLVDASLKEVQIFFGAPVSRTFDVFIHPSRASLDQQWQRDWNMPEFKSECWMVASGTALKLDLVSPRIWDKEACEHRYADQLKTSQLITHEMVHVFHGQRNSSPDFSDVDGIDWFVEGLATYASGQCDNARISEVKKALASNGNPQSLDQFWQGKWKYGLSGSMVKFLDHEYGRTKVVELLRYNKKQEILNSLAISEGQLISKWANYMQKQ